MAERHEDYGTVTMRIATMEWVKFLVALVVSMAINVGIGAWALRGAYDQIGMNRDDIADLQLNDRDTARLLYETARELSELQGRMERP